MKISPQNVVDLDTNAVIAAREIPPFVTIRRPKGKRISAARETAYEFDQ